MRKLQVVATPQGWLGNQLFCVFAALQYAEDRNADLFIETNYGFQRNKEWDTKYELYDLSLFAPYKQISTPYQIIQKIKRRLIRQSTFFQWLFSTKFITERNFFCKVPSYIQTLILDDYFNNYRFVSKFHGTSLDFESAVVPDEIKCSKELALHFRVYGVNDTNYTFNDQIKSVKKFIATNECSPIHIFTNDAVRVRMALEEISHNQIYFHDSNSAKQDIIDLSCFRRIFFFGSTYGWWAAFSTAKDKEIFIPGFTTDNPSGGFLLPNVKVIDDE